MNPWLAAYQALFPAVGVAVAAQFLLGGRGRTLREGKADLKQRLGYASPEDLGKAGEGAFWLHAASVGELSGAATILKELGIEGKVLVTTSTVAGRSGAAQLSGAACAVLAPMDLVWAVDRFLDAYKPKALVILETELWPATLAACVRRAVPFAVANARMTARSFPRYRWIRPLLSPYLAQAAAVAAQTEADAERFAALGVPSDRIRVTGNVKYDSAAPAPEAVEAARRTLSALGWRPDTDVVWCAGSVRSGEETTQIVETFDALRPRFPNLRLILAPRHIEGGAPGDLAHLGIPYENLSRKPRAGFSSAPVPVGPAQCLVVDQLGKLRAFYGASDLAFVGGTLVPVGGHNLLEPAAAGVPVLFGPHTGSIQAPADALAEAGGFRAKNARDLTERIAALLQDADARKRTGTQARKTAEGFAGAARRTAVFLREQLHLREAGHLSVDDGRSKEE